MQKNDLLNSDFLKQFKTGDELNSFLKELQKRGVEQLLEGEMDAYQVIREMRYRITPMLVMALPRRPLKQVTGNPKCRFPDT